MKNVGKCFKDTTGSPGPKIETNNTNKNKNYREHRLLKVQKERKPRWHSFHFIENFVSTRLELLFILRIITYKMSVTKNYIGLTEGTFKQRFSQHKATFKHRKYTNSTELSKYIWKLRDNKIKTSTSNGL